MSVAVIVAKLGSGLPSLFLSMAVPIGAATPVSPRPSTVGIVVLVVALLIGIPLAYRLWREAHAEGESDDGADLLSDFRQAYEEGQMDEDEFRRIREVLIGAKGTGRTKARPAPPRDAPGRLPGTPSVPPAPAEAEANAGPEAGDPVDEPDGPATDPPPDPGPRAQTE